MAARILSFFSTICFLFLCLCLVSLMENGFTFVQAHASKHTHTVQVSSLMPSSICDPSSTVAKQHKSSLKVIHKYGPCSHLNQDHTNFTELIKKILQRDQLRVESIRAIFKKSGGRRGNDTRFQQAAATTLPAQDGNLLGNGNYFVTVGLGTPKKDLSLAFDTGSDLTWTQCQPCAGHCYNQQQNIFDPSASSSYANESCTSQYCSTFQRKDCLGGTCIYSVAYGDKSYTEGFLAKETLTLTPSDVIDGFLFGCGQNNDGLFKGIAGLLGLGLGETSIVKQASQKYNGLFSYCLPSNTRSTGQLTFGGGSNTAAKYTPMLPVSASASFYGIQLLAITVGGVQVVVPASSMTIIDSGTEITRLPPAVYSAVRSEFQKLMTQYPPTPGIGPLDTCYDVSSAGDRIQIPIVRLSFGGEVTVDLPAANIVVPISRSKLCLAFAGDGDNIAILGNNQHKGFEVVYDIGGQRIGFSQDIAC